MGENAKSEKLEVKSFRISAETAEKFKEISAEIGGNQQQTMAKLIETFELQQGKASLTDYKANIEEFDSFLLAIGRLYTSALESNQLMKERVRAEYSAELWAKDAVIKELNDHIDQLKAEKREADITAATITSERDRLVEQVSLMEKEFEAKLGDMAELLNEREQRIQLLTELIDTLKGQHQQQEQLEKPKKRRGRPPKVEDDTLEGQISLVEE